MRRDGAANRERIMLAAEHVFGVGGSQASTEEVARRAGVGVATVFRHFPTKQALLEATSLRYLEGMEADVRRLANEVAAGQALATAVRLLVDTGPTKVTLLNLLLSEGETLSDTVVAKVEAVRELVRHLLERAQAADAARQDVSLDDVLTVSRALAHIGEVDQGEQRARAVGIVLDGLHVQAVARGG